MELIREILKRQTLSRKEIFRIVYGDGLSETGVFQIPDFYFYSEDARKDFILEVAQEDRELLDDFLKKIYLAIVVDAPFVCVDNVKANSRAILLNELLRWVKWGVDVRSLPIYQVAFALVYYQGIDVFGFKLENYNDFPKGNRAQIVQGLCSCGCTNVLEAFVLNSQNESHLNCDWSTKKWRVVGIPRQQALLFELSNWCAWGADIPAVTNELCKILSDYLDRFDYEAFCEALDLCEEYLSPDQKQNLRQEVIYTVLRVEINNSRLANAFRDVLNTALLN